MSADQSILSNSRRDHPSTWWISSQNWHLILVDSPLNPSKVSTSSSDLLRKIQACWMPILSTPYWPSIYRPVTFHQFGDMCSLSQSKTWVVWCRPFHSQMRTMRMQLRIKLFFSEEIVSQNSLILTEDSWIGEKDSLLWLSCLLQFPPSTKRRITLTWSQREMDHWCRRVNT